MTMTTTPGNEVQVRSEANLPALQPDDDASRMFFEYPKPLGERVGGYFRAKYAELAAEPFFAPEFTQRVRNLPERVRELAKHADEGYAVAREVARDKRAEFADNAREALKHRGESIAAQWDALKRDEGAKMIGLGLSVFPASMAVVDLVAGRGSLGVMVATLVASAVGGTAGFVAADKMAAIRSAGGAVKRKAGDLASVAYAGMGSGVSSFGIHQLMM